MTASLLIGWYLSRGKQGLPSCDLLASDWSSCICAVTRLSLIGGLEFQKKKKKKHAFRQLEAEKKVILIYDFVFSLTCSLNTFFQ